MKSHNFLHIDLQEREQRAKEEINSDIDIRRLDENLAKVLARTTPSYVFSEAGELIGTRYSSEVQEIIDKTKLMKREIQDRILRRFGLHEKTTC